MKRVLALLLAVLMAAALCACGKPAETKTLKVAMECAYAPYNWTQTTEENGAVPISGSSDFAYGYDVMMAKKIAESLGYELEIVKLDWEGIIPAVMTGAVDLAICGQSITAERLEQVDFSSPYYYASIIALAKSDGPFASATSVAELDGATCVSQLNTVWNDICAPQIPNVNLLPGMESAPAMLVALTSGRVDLVVTDQPTGLAATTADPSIVMLEFEGDGAFQVSDEEINIGISMKKGNAELLDAVNGVLATMTPEDYTAMMNDAIAVQPLS